MIPNFDWLDGVKFGDPLWLLVALLAVPLLVFWRRLSQAVANTFGHGHKIKSVAWPHYLCGLLLFGMWLAFAGALAQPKVQTTVFNNAYQAREFVLGIDSSGSMFSMDVEGAELAQKVRAWEKDVYQRAQQKREEFPSLYPNPPEKPQEVQPGNEDRLSRFALARWAAVQFVQNRLESSKEARKQGKQGDRAGMFTFDDEPYWAWPLSSDLNIVIRKLEWLLNRSIGGGTNFDGPSDEGNQRMGAFQASINHFRKWGAKSVKTKVIILISDGDAGISEKRHQELVRQMTEEGMTIHVYALVCGPRTQLENASTESVRKLIKAVNPDDPSKPEFQQAVVWAGDGEAMANAFAMINRLEASTIEGEPSQQARDVRHQFILAGSLLGALFVLACAAFRENF